MKPGFTFIDVGCGNGFFALPAARLVGEKGKVYGLDVNAEAIEMLKKTAMKEGLRNLNLRVGVAEETVFCHACADIVFFGIVLHDFKDASKVLSNATRMIKSKGKLVDLDWKKEPMDSGPPLRIRFSEEKAASLIEAAGFKINSIRDAGPHHYLIIAKLLDTVRPAKYYANSIFSIYFDYWISWPSLCSFLPLRMELNRVAHAQPRNFKN